MLCSHIPIWEAMNDCPDVQNLYALHRDLSILQNAIYRFNKILMKTPFSFFMEIEKNSCETTVHLDSKTNPEQK